LNWIRVAVAIGDDPDIHRLADALGCPVTQSVGLVVLALTKFPEHAPDGNLAQVPDSLIERWAGWDGERGKFAAALRQTFLNPQGVWVAWEKHNGAAMRDALAARARAAEHRRRKANELLDTPNGTGNGSPNGSPLRTNERTNLTTGGGKRLNSEPAPYNLGGNPPKGRTLVIMRRLCAGQRQFVTVYCQGIFFTRL